MQRMAFVHLRTHTEFSVVDGSLRIDELTDASAADRQGALAITDLSNLFGAVKFYVAARRRGIKPLIGADLWLLGRDFNVQGDHQQWAWAGRGRRHHALAYPALRGANQLLNAAGALAALEALRDRLPVNAQAVRSGFAMVELAGRFQIVPGQPAIVLDVAHNPQSVGALVANLDQMGYFPRTHAVFGVMADKDIDTVLRLTAPLVDAWYLCDLPLPRAATAAALSARVPRIHGTRDIAVSAHASPVAALRAALGRADPADRIVVFGSFYTVGGVLKDGLPRTAARHLG